MEWIEVAAPGGRTMRAAVARPESAGPAPVLVMFHGSGGFAQSWVDLAADFARAGYVAVAGAWFAGSAAPRAVPPDLIDCPDAPAFRGSNLDTVRDARALVDAARALPGVRADRVGLFGHSRGATLAVLLACTGADPRAVVAGSGVYSRSIVEPDSPIIDTLPITLVEDLHAPLLLLHSEADAIVDVVQAREFAAALERAGKPFEVHYYQDAPHGLWAFPATKDDVRERAVAFLRRHL